MNVELARTGDRKAFAEVYCQYRTMVYAIALKRLRNTDDAEELTQDVFLRVLRKLPQLRDITKFAGWLVRVTNNLANSKVRRLETLPDVADIMNEPLDVLIRDETIDTVRFELSQLCPMDQEALEAFYIRGLSLKEIAAELAIPLGTVKRRISVARKRLGKKLAA